MSKRFNKNNLTRILHDIRESYSKTFHEPIPKGADMENVLIDAARMVKEGKRVSWQWEDGKKKLILS